MRQEMTKFWDAVANANNLHLAPDRKPHQHPITQLLQTGRSSWRPTKSVKALKLTFCISYFALFNANYKLVQNVTNWEHTTIASENAKGLQLALVCSVPQSGLSTESKCGNGIYDIIHHTHIALFVPIPISCSLHCYQADWTMLQK